MRPQRSLEWRVATLAGERRETATARTLLLDVDGWPGHLPGQHVDVRLTAPDGYSAQRSYSIASPANGERVELTVQGLPDGEVSSYLVDDYALGDPIELRGPIGGWFVWDPSVAVPVVLVAGGSGIVPLMAMVRTWSKSDRALPMQLVYSARSPSEVLYRDELASLAGALDINLLYTRQTPVGWHRQPGRVSRADLDSPVSGEEARCYVCGPTAFVEHVAGLLVELGYDDRQIRTERFGPT